MIRLISKVTNRDFLCRVPGIVPICFLANTVYRLLFSPIYRYPSFDPSCLNTKCAFMLLGIILIVLFGFTVSVWMFRGNFKYSLAAGMCLCAAFVPFGILGGYLSENLREEALLSHTTDISNYGEWDDEVYQRNEYYVLPNKSLVVNGELEYILDRTKRYGLKPGYVKVKIYLDETEFAKEMERIRLLEIDNKYMKKAIEGNEIRFFCEDPVVYAVFASVSYIEESGMLCYSLFYGSDYWETGAIP